MSSDSQLNPSVFVVQESRYTRDGQTISHDYSSLYKYGRVTFLLPTSRRLIAEQKVTELELLTKNLSEFNADRDYLVFSGDPVLCAQAAIVAYNLTEPGQNIQVLKWNKKSSRFDPVMLYVPSN